MIFNYCLICENVISIPVVEEIKQSDYNIEDGVLWGLIKYLASKEEEKRIRSYTHEIYCKNTKIGECIILITCDVGNGEKVYSTKNLYTVLNDFGKKGWEVVSTNIDYYPNDESQHDIEKRYFLKEILQFDETNENQEFLSKTVVTRTKYLMKQSIEPDPIVTELNPDLSQEIKRAIAHKRRVQI